MSAATVIDAARDLRPRAVDRSAAGDPFVAATLARLEAKAEGRDARGVLELALNEEFEGRAAVVSSFGSESVVLLHMVSQIAPNAPILFLNTGKLFGETLRYRDRLQDALGLGDIRSIGPNASERDARDPEGTLWSRDADACCAFRKTVPIRRALEGFAAQVTGRKRFQTQARAEMRRVEYFEGRFRFNPLADWTREDLEAYIAARNLPRHPLVEDGYPSIGCIPCTRRVRGGEGYRDGRWSGLDKDECGIHGLDGEGI